MDEFEKIISGKQPCVAVSADDSASIKEVRKAVKLGAGLLELRIDLFSSTDAEHVLKQIRRFPEFPILATIRSKAEGGKWKGGDETRLQLFQEILPHVSAVDIELSSTAILRKVIAAARKAGKTAVVSYHNFQKTPSRQELESILRRAKSSGAGVIKIAAMISGKEDLRRLAAFTLEYASEKLIAVGMGPAGTPSRVALPLLGSLVTYTSLGRPTAPGQMDYKTALGIFKRLA